MTSEIPSPLYLIAHKVRGERAFDIAQKLDMGDEYWWIISTSGHRAYPFWFFPLNDLLAYTNVGQPPADLPDHYRAHAEVQKAKITSDRNLPKLEDL